MWAVVSGHSEHTASTCELPGGHISMEDAMRKTALEMMYYLHRSRSPRALGGLPEEAERNSYA